MVTEKTRQGKIIEAAILSFLFYFILLQLCRLRIDIGNGIVSFADGVLNPLNYIQGVFIGLTLAALTYFIIPSGIKELVREYSQAMKDINKLKEDRKKLGRGQRTIINYAMKSGNTDIDSILDQTYRAVTRGSSGKYGLGAIGGGAYIDDPLAKEIVETLLSLTDEEIVSLKTILDDFRVFQMRVSERLGLTTYESSDREKQRSPEINRPQLIDLAERLGILPSERGYSIHFNNYGEGWFIDLGDKSNKKPIEQVEDEKTAISRAKILATRDNLPYQGFYWY